MSACGCPYPADRFISPLKRPQKGPAINPSLSSTFSARPSVFLCFPVRGPTHSYQQLQWRLPSYASRAEHDEQEERAVHYEVDVVSWRERRIRAKALVHADVDAVWRVLTDYERLADFIPNLIYSGRIPCPDVGRIWLEQRGMQRALYWQIEARVVLDLQEFNNLDNERELQFTMVDGDFIKFEGKWSVKTGPRSSTAILTYEVSVIPRFSFPAIFLERIIRSDLPVNLRAVACRAEKCIEDSQMTPLPVNTKNSSLSSTILSQIMNFSSDMSETDSQNLEKLKESRAGHAFGSVPPSSNNEFSRKCGLFGKFCRLDKLCMADEVHLRKFNGLLENGGSHHCVVASITVKAPVHDVWNVLTAYETLPEIVPNLAISKILLRDNSKVRILQEGCKGLLYMVLHARVVLDLHEKHEEEISFEQVEGDFASFQGKWQLEQLGDQHTLLKYSVESKMCNDNFLPEAIVEEVVYKDLPSNLCAIRDFVENRVNAMSDPPTKAMAPAEDDVHMTEDILKENISSMSSNTLKYRPRVPGLQKDLDILKTEIARFVSEHGQEGFMPMRKQLRLHGRVDIEKAITRLGGFRKVASLVNLSLAYKHRKPKGYWDSLENMQEEGVMTLPEHWRNGAACRKFPAFYLLR
ncbi:uncharacterized protein LOC110035672 isoform X2 [Phalaenopsis equestris]|uniref:uncharacterized protein LOC110035672 isoform X2 n=1 Tax=Phalaenopsis equestris TaxID=78828 RepID=UPI0009E5573B|nr:uncharacterized protein LOC110035672 isoform X2 [Phalaenopsis equestris]